MLQFTLEYGGELMFEGGGNLVGERGRFFALETACAGEHGFAGVLGRNHSTSAVVVAVAELLDSVGEVLGWFAA